MSAVSSWKRVPLRCAVALALGSFASMSANPATAFASAVDVGIGPPGAVATDARGNVYFSSPNLVLKLDSAGRLTRVAGNGTPGYSGDGGLAANALLNNMPFDSYPEEARDPIDFSALIGGLAVDTSGNLYISDAYNNRVRKISPGGIITTMAGSGGFYGFGGDPGDGGQATQAQISWPQGVAVDGTDTVYVASVYGMVRKITPDGLISSLTYPNCGPGYLGPGVCVPEGIALSSDGAVYVADGYCRVRKIGRDGTTITVAGDDTDPDGHGFAFTCGHTRDTGPATKAALAWPYGVAVDKNGNLVIADTSNHCIRTVDAAGNIATVAGTCGVPGFSGDGGIATNALLDKPYSVAADSSGNLFIADTFNQRIRRVAADGTITTVVGNGGAISLDLPVESIAIGPGFTGSWYDPAQSGHGLFVEVLSDNRLYAAWFAFDPAGTQQAWFSGVGTYSGNTATITDVQQPTGGRWIPNFDPNSIVRIPWGTLSFTFTDCNHGQVEFTSVAGYGTGSMTLARLTQPAGVTCP